jgi:predicted dithiol-disulfide oxidoreductase (DUF899 family)
MTKHLTKTREEWLAARLELLYAEKEEQQREGGVEYSYRRGGHAMDETQVPEPVAQTTKR